MFWGVGVLFGGDCSLGYALRKAFGVYKSDKNTHTNIVCFKQFEKQKLNISPNE